MAYKAMYREWRPKSFIEVIGQDHVSVTLQNAVKSGRVGHAYLFCGPRGTGKTSSAKVFAKALNCVNGPTTEPCNECVLCEGINIGNSLDVIEIDAASNRGIDEIRDLREKVKFAPSECRYKVYIIDEVHMLTTEAFNALLKTLEEPPGQVVFILATTEPYKIPATILSRVQRFDFKRISIANIVARLRDVITQMSGEVSDDALLMIARKAEGGMRDALSLLDQCYKEDQKLELEKVIAVLGSLSEEEIFALAEKILGGDSLGALAMFDSFLLEGKDTGQILRELTEHLRNLLIMLAAGKDSGLVHASKEFMPKLIRQSSEVSSDKLIELISLFVKTDGELRFSAQPRISMEVALITGCSQTTFNQSVPKATPRNIGQVTNSKDDAKIQGGQSTDLKSGSKPDLKTGDQLAPEKELKSVSKNKGGPDIARIRAEWPKVLEMVKKKSMGTHALLKEGEPSALNSDVLVLTFKERSNFHREKIDQPDNKSLVEQALFSVVGYPLGLKCITGNDAIVQADTDDLITQTINVFGKDKVHIKE